MKRMKTWMFALIVSMGAFLTSCINNDSNYDPYAGGIVEVSSNFGTTYFTDVTGMKIYPTYGSLAAVESNFGFKTSDTKMAYAIFTYQEEGNETANETGILKNANMQNGFSLDQRVELIDSENAPNDSVSTAPIIALKSIYATNISTNLNPLTIINNRYLVVAVEYFLLREKHYFTLVYNPEDNQEDGKMVLRLKHSGTPESVDVYTTSYAHYLSGYSPELYLKSFDLQRFFSRMGNPETVTIEVRTDVNKSINSLEASEEVIYSIEHTRK